MIKHTDPAIVEEQKKRFLEVLRAPLAVPQDDFTSTVEQMFEAPDSPALQGLFDEVKGNIIESKQVTAGDFLRSLIDELETAKKSYLVLLDKLVVTEVA
jgi:hypothetical protein